MCSYVSHQLVVPSAINNWWEQAMTVAGNTLYNGFQELRFLRTTQLTYTLKELSVLDLPLIMTIFESWEDRVYNYTITLIIKNCISQRSGWCTLHKNSSEILQQCQDNTACSLLMKRLIGYRSGVVIQPCMVVYVYSPHTSFMRIFVYTCLCLP